MEYHNVLPELSVSGKVFRYYIGKTSGKLRLSKSYPCNEYTGCEPELCRETTASNIRDTILFPVLSAGSRKNYYTIMPIAKAMKKDKTYYGHSTINLHYEKWAINPDDFDKIKNTDKDIIYKSLNYIVGIIGVLLSSDRGEVDRRKHGIGTIKDIDCVTKDDEITFKYSVLSPAWFITPMTVSLILGMCRETISISVFNTKFIKDNLLSKISLEEVNEIIMNCDRNKALKMYKNIIIPFYEKISSSHVVLSNKDTREVFHPLLVNGITSIFKPQFTKYYWFALQSHFGIDTLLNSLGYDSEEESIIEVDSLKEIHEYCLKENGVVI